MTRITMARTWPVSLAFVALVLAPAVARAQQVDVNPPLPNVLLLIDNSGSMERMIDGSLPEASPLNACNCDPGTGVCNWANQPAPNRWGIMLQTLAGSFQNGYNCAAMPRTPGSVFASEYQINGVPPYDVNYYLPYHRPIGKDMQTTPATPLACVYAPGALPGATTPNGVGPQGIGAGGTPNNATDFPSSAIVNNHTYGVAGTKTCVFPQATDGMIDSERDIMRFGLMTFDQDPDPGTGTTATNQVATPAFTGNWSYYPGWNIGAAPPNTLFGAPAYFGNPANCTTQTEMVVGARNPAAPPWEGRMIPFPATTDLAAQETQNDHVQQVLMASRPYGATPLAGMFVGARYYFQSDPTGPQQTDVYVQGGCRDEFIILLTDGAPNLDMRTACEGTGAPNGVCPFPLPEDTATNLKTPTSGRPVTTYVVGFAVSSFLDQGTLVKCSDLVSNGQLAAVCNDPTQQTLYGPCCELQKIALNGGTTSAYFADTPGDLQSALGSILAQIAKKQTTRTIPAYSAVVSNVLVDPNAPPNAQSNSSVYLASFTPSPGRPWSGDIQRQRFTCETAGQSSNFTVQTQAIDPSVGDDFADDLNSNVGARTVIMLQPDTLASGPGVDSTTTIRPFVSSSVGDGLGEYGVTMFAGDPATVISKITPPALGLTDTNCGAYNAKNGGGVQPPLSATQCRDMLLDFTFGLQSFGDQPNFPFVSRYGNALGDIFHAVPVVVGPPASLLRDDSYVAFRALNALRKQVVYAATNDGLLHAFWADETKLENNEIWTLMPPAVMPNLLASYPASHEFLLDGSPVTKDVVWDRPLSNQGDPSNWHTMLVAGFGTSQRGYYAIDVSSTETTGIPHTPAEPSPVGPVFLWQLTKMPATNMQLFGAHAGTPAITSLFVDPGDGLGAREIGVALLPGGQDTGAATFGGGVAKCDRLAKTTDSAPANVPYPYRTSVQCWGTPPPGNAPSTSDPVIGRSLSIVRLDTGEILRVFTRAADVPATTDTLFIAKRITDTPLDSPMTGTPVVYPSDIGTDATKAFVGDADGTIWRFDLSSSNPTDWVGELYLDLYNTTADTSTTTSWSDGQPIQVPLVTSLDLSGNLVLSAASGSYDTFDTTGVYYTYSITETVQGTTTPKLRASVNWWIDPAKVTAQAGERVSGPMTVFDGVLYFATYAAAPTGSQACSSGHARIWGLDFVTPADTGDLSKGGLARLTPPPPIHPQYLQPDETDATLLGVVVPGVSINATPACAGTASTSDPYVAGAQHSSPQGFTAGGYSVFSQLGTSGANGAATRQFSMSVPQPISPTMIDSWAAVLE
jgi:type IV pilus assembly protein PilY1